MIDHLIIGPIKATFIQTKFFWNLNYYIMITSFFSHFSLIATKKNSTGPKPRNVFESQVGVKFWVQDEEKFPKLGQGPKLFSKSLTYLGRSVEACCQVHLPLSDFVFKGMFESELMAKVSVSVRFWHENGQVDNFAVSFFISKIDRGNKSKSLRIILVSQVLIKTK